MANYLYLFRGGDMQRSPEEMQKNMQKWAGWIEVLAQKGHFQAGEPLDRGGKVVRGRKKNVTDGPFAEAKDLVGGYLIVTANDYAHATELAQGCPVFEDDGTVEIRELHKMSM